MPEEIVTYNSDTSDEKEGRNSEGYPWEKLKEEMGETRKQFKKTVNEEQKPINGNSERKPFSESSKPIAGWHSLNNGGFNVGSLSSRKQKEQSDWSGKIQNTQE